jgi:hypothetical protein
MLKNQISQALRDLTVVRSRNRDLKKAAQLRILDAAADPKISGLTDYTNRVVNILQIHTKTLPCGQVAYMVAEPKPSNNYHVLALGRLTARRIRASRAFAHKRILETSVLSVRSAHKQTLDYMRQETRDNASLARGVDNDATLAHRRSQGMQLRPTVVKGGPSARYGMTHRINTVHHGAVCPQCRQWVDCSDTLHVQCTHCNTTLKNSIMPRVCEPYAELSDRLLPHRYDSVVQGREWRSHDWRREVGKYHTQKRKK